MKTAFTFFIICFLSYSAFAQKAGTLDSSFGIKGKVTVNFGVDNSPQIIKAFLQSDGKTVEIGSYQTGNIGEPYGFLAVRFTKDGQLDYTYGDSGKAVVSLSGYSPQANGGAIQKDDKILISGYGYSYFPNKYVGVIVRLNTNGVLDKAFGNNGMLMQPHTNGYSAIAVQNDNKILAENARNDSNFLSRYLRNGTVDSSFGKNGDVFLGENAGFSVCKVQADKKIILAGGYGAYAKNFYLVRYLPDGKKDKSFGKNGVTITKYNDYAYITDMAFQSNGKIIAVGETITNTEPLRVYFATARYTADGILDTTFGENGKATTLFGRADAVAYSVVIQNDDKPIIGGVEDLDTNKTDFVDSGANFAMVRLTPNGNTDNTFSNDGKVVTNFGFGSDIKSVLLQSDGKIVAAGNSGYPPIFNCSVARYNNDIFNNELKRIQNNNTQANSLNNVSIYPNPAQNVLRVEGLSSKAKLIVVDVVGNIKLQTIAKASSYNLNIASLTAGNYLLKIEMNDIVVTKQFIKQ